MRHACLEATQVIEATRGIGYRFGIAGGLSGRERFRRADNATRAATKAKATTAKAYPAKGHIALALNTRRAS